MGPFDTIFTWIQNLVFYADNVYKSSTVYQDLVAEGVDC